MDAALRRRLATLLVAFTASNADALVDALLELGMARRPVDRDALRQDVARLLERYGGAGIGEIPLVAVLEQLLGIVRRHHLRLPRDLALLLKVLVIYQGMAASLAPEFRLEDVLAPYAQRLVQQQLSPEALGPRIGEALTRRCSSASSCRPSCGACSRRSTAAASKVRLRADDLESAVGRTERVGNRVVAALLASALLDALTRQADDPPRRWRSRRGVLAAGEIGGLASLGAYLAWTSRRRG